MTPQYFSRRGLPTGRVGTPSYERNLQTRQPRGWQKKDFLSVRYRTKGFTLFLILDFRHPSIGDIYSWMTGMEIKS